MKPHPKRHACPVAPWVNPLVKEFFRLADGKPLTEIATRAGYSHTVPAKWKRHHDPQLTVFCKHLDAIGCDLVIVQREKH